MPNGWSRQAYVQGFDYESITFKKYVNMFERMETTEYTYEGLVEPTYKNLTVQTPTMLVKSGKIEEKPPRHGLSPRRARAPESAEKGM